MLIILGRGIETNMQPGDAETGGAEPHWFIGQGPGYCLADALPQGINLANGCLLHESGQVAVSGRGVSEGSITAARFLELHIGITSSCSAISISVGMEMLLA